MIEKTYDVAIIGSGAGGGTVAQELAPLIADGRKILVVLVDNAGWHVARRLVVPPNVVLHFLPPCTPELQPVETFWPLVREAVANRSIGRIDRLRAILRRRLEHLARNPSEVQPRVGFRWTLSLER